jgi:hypothetical protein
VGELLEWIENKKFICLNSEAEHSAENILQEAAVRRGRELDSKLYDWQGKASSPHNLANQRQKGMRIKKLGPKPQAHSRMS